MISFPHGKGYDTSKPPEKPHQPSAQPPARGEATDTNRLKDGAAVPLTPPAPAAAALAAPAPKPAWSVLSAADLEEAIRREGRTDDPARLRQEAQRAERERVSAGWAREDRAADAAKVERDRHRNAWETT